MRRETQRLIVVPLIGLSLIVAYFVYSIRPGPCDGIFEQTAPKLDTTVRFLKANGEVVIGREKVQELAEGAQKVGLLCKTCCIAQQSGKINAEQFQTCLNGAKSYETQVIQVANTIDEAQSARQRGDDRLANEKMKQAKLAAGAAAASVQLIVESPLRGPEGDGGSAPVNLAGSVRDLKFQSLDLTFPVENLK
jgi:hypothetical protein